MKIAFDEHIPAVMVKVFKALAAESHVIDAEFCSAFDYGTGTKAVSDVPWLDKFKADGGSVVISGDKKMRGNPHERQALVDAEFIVFFFAPKWNHETFFGKTALLLKWWPDIEKMIANSSPGAFWEIEHQWNSFQKRDVTYKAASRKASKRAKRKLEVVV